MNLQNAMNEALSRLSSLSSANDTAASATAAFASAQDAKGVADAALADAEAAFNTSLDVLIAAAEASKVPAAGLVATLSSR